MNNPKVLKKVQIDGDFSGFDSDVLFKLYDGTYWVQDEYKYWYFYAYCPTINLLSQYGRTYLQVDGQAEMVAVRQVFDVVKSKIAGDFNGWSGDTTYELTNGQTWQQRTYHYTYTYSFMPDVLIYNAGGGHKMQVAGTTADVRRTR